MPHLRQNLVTKQWVIVSTERAQRPKSLSVKEPVLSPDLPPYEATCPFCPGNDGRGEQERMRIPEEGPWEVRVLANKYPALNAEGDRQRTYQGVVRRMQGVGYHEVIVESRQHNLSPALAPPDLLLKTFLAFQQRGRMLARDDRLEHIQYFKNHGEAAGASLVHPHSQLVALPVVPYSKRSRTEEARHYFDNTGECAYCRMMHDELALGERIIVENDYAVAFVLYAAFSPFHIWVLPRRHVANFLEASHEDIAGVTSCLYQVLRLLHWSLNDPPYNYILRSCPLRESTCEYLHWYVSVIARISTNAGFELGSGMFINSTLPEDSAAFLRAAAEHLLASKR